MEKISFKCSFTEHNEIDAIKYCEECKIYLCNKCDKFHSGLFLNHHSYSLDKEPKDIFTGLCKIENHQKQLEYFCKEHNELCCACCITKIKSKGNGQHTDCNICNIEDIYEEKKNNLENNIKSLEGLSEVFLSSLKDLNENFEKISQKKEEIKLNIQRVFTKIRNELSNREDELLLEVDNQFKKYYFSEELELLKDKDKLPNKVKVYLEKGKSAKDNWNSEKNKLTLINDCINIEKIIKNMNEIKQGMNKYKSNQKTINFLYSENEMIEIIKKFGSIKSKENKIKNLNQQETNVDIDDFDWNKIKYIKNISQNVGYGGNMFIYDGICFFISKSNENVLGYIDANSGNKSIIFYDVNKNNEIKRINNAHDKNIHIIKYYNYSLYDLILTSSCNDDIKLWNYNQNMIVLTISNIFKDFTGEVFSACIVMDEKISNILCIGNFDYIKIYDSYGYFYKNIGNNDESRRYIDICELIGKRYIISGSNKGILIFNYPDFTEYHRFLYKNDNSFHNYAKIIKMNDIYNLIDVGYSPHIRIWNFFNKNLLSSINVDSRCGLAGFITINNRYLIIGSEDFSIKEYDLLKKVLLKNLDKKHTSNVLGIKSIIDSSGRTFFVSYGQDKNMYLWGLE